MEIMEITKEFEDLLREAFEAGQDQMNDEWTRNYSTAMYPAVENADLTFEDWLKEKKEQSQKYKSSYKDEYAERHGSKKSQIGNRKR